MSSEEPRRGRRPWWIIYLAAGALVTAVYAVVLHGERSPVASAVFTGAALSVAVVIAFGIRLNRPARKLPWVLFGLSQLVLAAGDASHAAEAVAHAAHPSVAYYLYLLRYPLVLAGLSLLVGYRNAGRDLPGLLDASTVTLGVALLSWLFVVSPVHDADLSTVGRVVILSHPIMDVALLAVALRFLLSRGYRQTAFYMVAVSLALSLVASTIYSYQSLRGTYQSGTVDVIWLLANVVLGAAALHPSARGMGTPSERTQVHSSFVRPWLLLAAALVAPAALLVQGTRGRDADVLVAAGACAILFTLTTLRMQTLIGIQRRLAITDSLTGLNTRRYLESEIPSRVTKAARRGESVALLIVDVDYFKRVNDAFGHPAGDEVLSEIARRLQSACRPGDCLARYGGEEFAFLASGVSVDDVMSLATRVRAQVSAAPIAVAPGKSVDVTVSVGATACSARDGDSSELLLRADRALYRAKALGRDRAVVGDATERVWAVSTV